MNEYPFGFSLVVSIPLISIIFPFPAGRWVTLIVGLCTLMYGDFMYFCYRIDCSISIDFAYGLYELLIGVLLYAYEFIILVFDYSLCLMSVTG